MDKGFNEQCNVRDNNQYASSETERPEDRSTTILWIPRLTEAGRQAASSYA